MFGGFLAGIGGSFLSLFYPGSWNEGLSSGQGIMAVALVIFARWNPMLCLWASLLFGGAAALGPALQSVGVSQGYYLFNAAPYVLTLADHDHHLLAEAHPGRRAGGAVASRSRCRPTRTTMTERYVACRSLSLALQRRPAAGEHRADHHRHADRFLRRRRLRRPDGLRPLADARADRADQARARRDARARASTSSTPAKAIAPTSPICRPTSAGARARSAPASAIPALRPHPGARRAGLGHHSRTCAARRRSRSSTSRARARSAPPISN